MSSLKQVIVSAILKVVEVNPALDQEGKPSGFEERDRFIRALIAELFPECPEIVLPSAQKEEITVDVPTLSDPVDEITEQVKTLTIQEDKKEKKKPGRKPKAKPEGTNIVDLNPTQKKKLKQVADDLKVECDKTALITYLNGLTPEEFDNKKFEDHIRDCFAPPKTEDEKVECELIIVEFDGKDYYVNEESKRVYVPKGEPDEDGNYPGWQGVGYVGMAEFKNMSLD